LQLLARMTRMTSSLAFACSALAIGCTSAQKKPLVSAALSEDETRRESFEATVRELDENPAYVDEFFRITLHHPKTLDRLLYNTATHLHQRPLADRAAHQLVKAPDGLKMTLIATLDASRGEQAALDATSAAIEERPGITADALVQRERAVRRTVRALIEETQHNASARRAFLAALEENRHGVAALLASNPDVMASLMKAIGAEGVERGKDELESFLGALED
jgi:hypothetical protein